MNTDLFLSILAMDAYNRGYDAGIDLSDPNNLANPSDADGTQIGDAKVIDASSSNPNSPEVAAGFYAIAYNTPFGQVISYRGTDDPSIFALDGSDIWHGWTFGAGFGTSQIDLAQAFYEAATGTDVFSSDGNAFITGPSLGGGLLGLVAN